MTCLLVPVKLDQHILDNFMLPNLSEKFKDGPSPFQQGYAPVHKARFMKPWMDDTVFNHGAIITTGPHLITSYVS